MIENDKSVHSSPSIFNSPIGKFVIEDYVSDSPNRNDDLMIYPSPKQKKSTIFMSQPSSHTTPVLKTNNVKKKLFSSQPSYLSEGI